MTWIEAARRIVERKGAEVKMPDDSFRSMNEFDFSDEAEEQYGGAFPGSKRNFPPDGAVLLDMFTASMLVQVHDALSPGHQVKFASLPLEKAVSVGWKVVA